MKIPDGSIIIVYGQKATVAQTITVGNKSRIYLDKPIVVPTKEYTRDYIDNDEIKNIEIVEIK